MSEKRKRGQNFTAEDKVKLVKLVAKHKEAILNKKTDNSANEAKHKSWNDVTDSFNATATVHRTKDSLIKLWEKMKGDSKIYYQSKCTTGEVKVCPLLEQVCAILGQATAYTGLDGGEDSDTSVESSDVRDTLIAEIEINPQNGIIEGAIIDISADDQLKKKSKLDILDEINTSETNELNPRRRPQISNNNERNDNISTLYSSIININKKKKNVEDLKMQLLQNEIDFKRKLYDLQLQAAAREVEIKTEILNQIKGGAINMGNLLGVPQKD